MRTLAFLALFAVAHAALLLVSSPAAARCTGGWAECYTGKQRTVDIRKDWYAKKGGGQKIGDIYCPGYNRPCQLRDNQRVIHGYIEDDGTVTNTSRQPVLEIESLLSE